MSEIVFMRIRVVAKRLGVSRSTIWRWIRGGILQKPEKIGGAIGWWTSDVSTLVNKSNGHVSGSSKTDAV